MKQVHASYSFIASTKTITLTGLNIDQDQLLLIVNATRGVQYFNFADSSLRATVTAGANTTVVLTDASTTGHANGDALVIYYDDQVTTQAVSGTVTANPGTNPFTVTGSVALDNASLVALENITVTVGSSVALAAGSAQIGSVTASISNFPATQTIAGTVTANLPSVPTHGVTIANSSVTVNGTFYQATQPVSLASLPSLAAGTAQIGSVTASISNFPATQVVSVSNFPATQPVSLASLPGSTVTVANFPATQTIAGTVTANLPSVPTHGVTIANSSVTVNGTFYQATQPVSLASLPSLAAGTAQIGSVTASISNFPATQTVAGTVTANMFGYDSGNQESLPVGLISYGSGVGIRGVTEVIGADGNPLPIAGTVTASLSKPTWTDYSGTITQAGTAVTAISTTERSYLLAQVTTGQMFLNIGATCTTGNGVYFSAGQGFAWETSVPQGIVSIISSVTGTNYVLKDG